MTSKEKEDRALDALIVMAMRYSDEEIEQITKQIKDKPLMGIINIPKGNNLLDTPKTETA